MRQHITTGLELVGGLLLVAAAAVWAAAAALPLGLAVGGIGLVGFSALITKAPALAAAVVKRRAQRAYNRAVEREREAVKA